MQKKRGRSTNAINCVTIIGFVCEGKIAQSLLTVEKINKINLHFQQFVSLGLFRL